MTLREKRTAQLEVILKDEVYLPKDNSFRPFVDDMYFALQSENRTITPKMNDAITGIVQRYAKHLKNTTDSDFIEKRDKLVAKVDKVIDLLTKCGYSLEYEGGKLEMLVSFRKQASRNGYLSKKQKLVLNKFYQQFLKKVEKSA